MVSLIDARVMVTGATGFIGSWLAERLVEEGAHVTILVRPRSPRISCIEPFEKKVKVIYGDIRDPEVVGKIVEDQDLVFHLAALTQVSDALRDPSETFSVNFQGTLNLLESLRRGDRGQALVYASTDKVYGEPVTLPITEHHPLIGKSPYDASKIAAERAVYAYFRSYGLPSTISRSSNVYGGRDLNFQRAIPDFMSRVLRGKPIVVRGSGRNVRDFMFKDDAIEGFIKLGIKLRSQGAIKGEAYNFGTMKPTSISELAGLVSKLAGRASYDVLGADTPGEIDAQYIDYKKAEEELGWRPQVQLEDGLRSTLQWYSNNEYMWKKFVPT